MQIVERHLKERERSMQKKHTTRTPNLLSCGQGLGDGRGQWILGRQGAKLLAITRWLEMLVGGVGKGGWELCGTFKGVPASYAGRCEHGTTKKILLPMCPHVAHHPLRLLQLLG